jgi:hypothetical protein
MTLYGFRIILDFKQADIFRDIEISSEDTFEDFHNSIVQAFALDAGEMASFYKSDEHWNQGEEISLFAVDEKAFVMSDWTLHQMCTDVGDKMLYVFDFLNMWTFYVELMEINEPNAGESYPRLIYSEGLMPGEREDIQFESEEDLSESSVEGGLFDDDIFEGFDDFEQYE